jgi:hypothetical protein
MSKVKELPLMVRKQAEQALNKLVQFPPQGKRLFVTFKESRVLIQEEVPHPTKPQKVRLPYALLDYSDDGWILLFRGAQGAWQRVPEDQPSVSIDDKVAIIRVDPHGVFWR